MNWNDITTNPEVAILLQELTKIEDKIKAIDENALIRYYLYLLSLPDKL